MHILLADDQPEVLEAIALTLRERFPGASCAQARSLHALLAASASQVPDLLLVEWEMLFQRGRPGQAVEVLRSLRRLCPCARLIVMSADPGARLAASQAGVDGFVCKADPPEQLIAVVLPFFVQDC